MLNLLLDLLVLVFDLAHCVLLADGVEGAGALLIQERECVKVCGHHGWVLARQLSILFYDLTDA